MVHHFAVLVHVAAQDAFQGTQQTFESVPVDPDESTGGDRFDASLPDSIFHQGDLPKVFSSLVLENFLNRAVVLAFFSYALSLCNDIEFVAGLSLPHNILVGAETFFSEGVTNLVSFVWIHIRQNINFG